MCTIKGTYWNMSKSSKGFLLTYLIDFVELYIKMHKCNSLIDNRRIVIVNVVKIIQKLQVWPTWWIKTAIDSETLFQDRRRAIQSFFWIKDFSFQFFLENCPPYCVTYGSMQTLGIRRSLEHTARWNTIFSHIYLLER